MINVMQNVLILVVVEDGLVPNGDITFGGGGHVS